MATPKGNSAVAQTEKTVPKRTERFSEIRFRVSPALRAAIEREAASEHMTLAAFSRACIVRILRARSH